jgi:pimeloyl-ACP methyl ester carboxylesterase
MKGCAMAESVLLEHRPVETKLTGALAYWVRYRSHDLRGVATESTGLVIAPSTPVTSGDERRVMTWCHGTTGLGDAACPSAQPDPAAELRTYFESGSQTQIDYGVPGLQRFIDEGWVVCATDYQGLGTPGRHQYTVNRTNAIDAVTIVHAARELDLGVGTRFATMGWSQGGAAAAAVAELTDADYDGLTLVGCVPMSPGVPISALRVPTGLGAAMTSGAVPPDGHLFMNLAGIQAAFPDELSLSDVFTDIGIRIHDENWNTQPVHHLSDILARANSHEGDAMSINKEKLPAWLKAMTEASASLVKARCPVWVAIDAQHDGSVVPVSWQEQYIADAQALGSDVTSKQYPNDDHFSLPQSCVDDARAWLAQCFDAR